MGTHKELTEESYFSSICVDLCGGMCCDPWWGIISYAVTKEGGLRDMGGFKAEVERGITQRAGRIVENYVTSEDPPRALFTEPEVYNVKVTDIKAAGTTLRINLLLMMAFRCRFLTARNACAIHPATTGGTDIRPPHCGYMGSPHVRPGEKGYCRIIHAAESRSPNTVEEAISVEKGASERHLAGGANTPGEAAALVVERVRAFSSETLTALMPKRADKVPGRNDPCHCGSGLKYKKCHGR